MLSLIYANEYGVVRNEREAVALLKCSRDPIALCSLGRRIIDGSYRHLPRNELVGRALCAIGLNATVMHRYEVKGEAREMNTMAVWYDFGSATFEKDLKKAMEIYHHNHERYVSYHTYVIH